MKTHAVDYDYRAGRSEKPSAVDLHSSQMYRPGLVDQGCPPSDDNNSVIFIVVNIIIIIIIIVIITIIIIIITIIVLLYIQPWLTVLYSVLASKYFIF